jgi:hypothetical protein
MLDWKSITLTPMGYADRLRYHAWLRAIAADRRDPITAIYERYKTLPADVAAKLLHLDMQRAGWDSPPQRLIDTIAAELGSVRMLFAVCAEGDIDADDYVDEANRAEVYEQLLKIHADDDLQKQAEAAAAFCRSTQ